MTRLLFVVAMLSLVGCDKLKTTSPSGGTSTGTTSTSPAKKTYTRAEFRSLLVGKTTDQVIAAVGKPDHTQESATSTTWYFRDATVDPVTGKTDATAQVVFEHGVVDRVNY